MSAPAPAGNVFQEYFINVLRYKYIQYHGRARRREYWMFCLFCTVFELILIAPLAMDLYIPGNLLTYLFQKVLRIKLEVDLDILWNLLMNLFTVATLVPSICLWIRRFHDIGKSGWWILVYFGIVIFAGIVLGFSVVAESLFGILGALAGVIVSSLIVLVFTCLDSQPGENRYGPNPKTESAEITETLI